MYIVIKNKNIIDKITKPIYKAFYFTLKGGEELKIIDFIKDIFGGKDEVRLIEKISEESTKLAIEEFAINVAINLIAGCISKCEFKTYLDNKEVKEDEYYMWNIEPNKNQNSSEFIQEFIYKLLYRNEVLIVEVNNQLIIADSFYQNEYALIENVFENVTRKDFTFNRKFKMSEVLYFKNSNKDLRSLVSNLNNGYRDLLDSAIGKYKRSGGRKGIAELDTIAKGDEEQKRRVDELFEKKFKKYFESENAVLSIPKGVKYTEQNGEGSKKSTSDMVDVQNLIKEIFDRVGQGFKIPPALMRGDIADVDKVTNNFLTFGIDPIVDLINEEINRKRYGKAILKGSRLEIDTTCIKHIDIFSVAEKIDKLISTGMYSIDGLLEKVGEVPLGTEWSEKHWITKNYSDINQIDLKGGEDNEQKNMGI